MRVQLLSVTLAAGLCCTAALAQNTGIQLVDGGAIYDVTSTGNAGTIPVSEPGGTAAGVQGNFRVTGGVGGTDNVYANWWWYRVNGTSTRELGIRQTTGTAVKTAIGTHAVNYAITSGGLLFDVTFTLSSLNATSANIHSNVRVTNTTASPVDISLFNMMDIFLGGQDASDRVLFAGASGGDRVINFDDSVLPSFKAQHRGFGAFGYGVGTFSAISAQVTDTSIDNFADVNGFTTPDDLSSVMQFNLGVIEAGATASAGAAFAVDVQGNDVTAVPAPGALALMGVGGLLAARRRRN
jgi:MYXO-CTERM domain-containing protein